jgi:hypothetical protein
MKGQCQDRMEWYRDKTDMNRGLIHCQEHQDSHLERDNLAESMVVVVMDSILQDSQTFCFCLLSSKFNLQIKHLVGVPYDEQQVSS